MTNNSLASKSLEASSRYLTLRGYDVISKDPSSIAQIVAYDEDSTLVFASVVPSYEEFNDDGITREDMEKAAAAYMTEHLDDIPSDICVRLDSICMLILSENRAIIRHHVAAYSR